MPRKAFPAPFARTACKIDFSNHATPNKARRVGLYDFTGELVSRRPAKAVVSPLEFKIRIADARTQ